MRHVLALTVMFCLPLGFIGCQEAGDATSDTTSDTASDTAAPISVTDRTVETGCGSCIYKMEGVKGCQTAVKIDGKSYLVTGVQTDAHEAGLCKGAKKAVVSGKVEGDKFVATRYELAED